MTHISTDRPRTIQSHYMKLLATWLDADVQVRDGSCRSGTGERSTLRMWIWHLLPRRQGLALCLRKIVVGKAGYVDRYIHDINRKILEEPAVSINASTDRKRREKKNTMYAV